MNHERRPWTVLCIWIMLALGGPGSGQVPTAAAGPHPPLVRIWLLEPVGPKGGSGPIRLRRLPAADPRHALCARLLENEAARFVRRLIAGAWLLAPPTDLRLGPVPPLPVVLIKGGNHAAVGFTLEDGGRTEEYLTVPYVLLEPTADRLSHTLLHEGGHVVHAIAARGRRPMPSWTPLPHSTFAVTDPLTALAEGYAIHLETLWGHFGSDPARRSFYHRLAPSFEVTGDLSVETYAPARDLLSFSQTWARYQAVRDGLPAFAAYLHPGDYLRSQYDPARDRAALKAPNAMVASEGVVASVLFWTAAGIAAARGARPGDGLEHSALLDAETLLVRSLIAANSESPGPYRPDLLDIVGACGTPGSDGRRRAIACAVDVTRGVTARPTLRRTWGRLYRAAVRIDQARVLETFQALESARQLIRTQAEKDASALRAGLGTVLPVRAHRVNLEIVGLGARFPLEFDLNASGEAEWTAVGGTARVRCGRILEERDRRPFVSMADFEARTGLRAPDLAIVAVAPSSRDPMESGR